MMAKPLSGKSLVAVARCKGAALLAIDKALLIACTFSEGGRGIELFQNFFVHARAPRHVCVMKSGLACRAPRMHLYMTMLAATAAVAVAKSPRLASPYLEQLPQTLRFALVAKHQELDAESKSKPGGANRFRLEEDASIILQHVRDKVPLREIKLPSRDSVTAGTNRWKYQINKWQLDGMDELCHGTQPFQKAMPPARPADSLDSTAACKLRHELHALNLELPLEMQEELVQIHACAKALRLPARTSVWGRRTAQPRAPSSPPRP
jgi:hypothetical protein